MPATYRGRFAPSPTGPLHAGSLVAALASWLDARACGGRWIVRLEDTDTPRCSETAAERILWQLDTCGLQSDEPVRRQSMRGDAYAAALGRLRAAGRVYRCTCSRSDIERALAGDGRLPPRHGERVYPGTCRDRGLTDVGAGAWRLRSHETDGRPVVVAWTDRRLGVQTQDVSTAVGDFVLQRADGVWAYQLAVVVDDADQGITDVVRGEDLADNTPRQLLLQQRLGLPAPRYLHTPLVLAADGQKLSKQTGAAEPDLADPVAALRDAARALGLPADLTGATSPSALGDWLAAAVAAWRHHAPPR